MANGNKKKSKKKIIIFSSIGVVLLVLLYLGLFSGSKEDIVAVQVEKAAKRTITQTVTATGQLDAENEVTISPEVTGEIVELPVKEGDKVKSGQLLVKINAKQYIAAQQSAEATLQAAKANLAMSKAQLSLQESTYKRIQQLYDKKLESDADLESAKSSYESAKASYDAAQANVQQNEAQLASAVEQVSKTTLMSPMNGTVTQLNIHLGDRVLGSGYSQGTNMMTVADLKTMEAVVNVDENDIVMVSKGDTAKITIDAYGDRVFKGIVTEIGNSAVTSGSGTQEQVVNFTVKIKLLDLDEGMRPGMSCNADIQTETKHDVISVPIQSVTARSDTMNANENAATDENNTNNTTPVIGAKKPQEIVFVVQNSKAKSVPVETGISDNNYIEIKSGLKGGEEIVSGSYRAIARELSNGSNVRIEKNAPNITVSQN
jgi:HlyD family secretion protein